MTRYQIAQSQATRPLEVAGTCSKVCSARSKARMIQKILIILENGDLFPSGTIRGLIYREHFRRAKMDVRYISRQSVPLARILNRPPTWVRYLLNPALL